MGDALGFGVVFTSTDGRERAAHLDEAQRAALADADLVDPTGRLRVERIDPDGTPVGDGEALVRCGWRPAASTSPGSSAAPRRADPPLRRARARAGRDRGRAAGDPRGGDHGRREQVPGRLPARRVPRPRGGGGVRRRARPGVRVAPRPTRDGRGRGARARRIAALAPTPRTGGAWQDRFAPPGARSAATVDGGIASVAFSREVVTLVPVDPRRDGRRPRAVDRTSGAYGATGAAAGSRSRPASAGSRQPRRAARGVPPGPARGRDRPPGARRRFGHPLRPARPAPAARAGARRAASWRVRGRRARPAGRAHRGGGRPARDAAGAARHQLQRGRGGARPVLPLQHDALPRRQAAAAPRAASRPTRTCGSTSRWRCGRWRSSAEVLPCGSVAIDPHVT